MPNKKNPLALAVLVHLYEKPRHPYELAATMRERGKEQSIKLNYGSLYTVIDSLLRDAHISARETLRVGNRPEKTVYEITPSGAEYMLDWMRDLVRSPVKEYPQFEAALSLIPVLPPDEVVALLDLRVQALKATLASFVATARQCEDMNLPRLFSLEGEYAEAMVKTELAFVKGLLADLRADTAGLTSVWLNVRKEILGLYPTEPKNP